MTIERDAFQYIVDVAGVVSAIVSLAAIGFAVAALRDSQRTASHLADTARATTTALERIEREQTASVLAVAHRVAATRLRVPTHLRGAEGAARRRTGESNGPNRGRGFGAGDRAKTPRRWRGPESGAVCARHRVPRVDNPQHGERH